MPGWAPGAWADGAWAGTAWSALESPPDVSGIRRYIPPDFQTALEECGVALAVCVRVERRDGVVYGFTSWDRELTVAGTLYDPCSVFDMSQIATSLGTGSFDNAELWGAIQSGIITDVDLRAGLYDGASCKSYLVIPTDLSLGKVLLLDGWLGESEYDGQSWRVQFVSKTDRMLRQVGEVSSPTCRAFVGDARCGVDLTPFTHTGSVTAFTSRRSFVVGAMTQDSGYFDYGICEFTSGANLGHKRKVKLHTLVSGEAVLQFQEEFPYDVADSDDVTLIAGCDGLFPTCINKYANAINFRGEPDLPGLNANIERTRQ